MYYPGLGRELEAVYRAQADEFRRLYGKEPSHVDGHQHKHLCPNMVLGRILPEGTKVRRNFTFFPGEKSWLNRVFRELVDRRLARRHVLTDYFFSLRDCLKTRRIRPVRELAAAANVEVMTHPIYPEEKRFLLSEESRELIDGVETGTYADLAGRDGLRRGTERAGQAVPRIG
jgi:predicted glycoside hydrolase/deacetylase ChbG (UPF0249 family)